MHAPTFSVLFTDEFKNPNKMHSGAASVIVLAEVCSLLLRTPHSQAARCHLYYLTRSRI